MLRTRLQHQTDWLLHGWHPNQHFFAAYLCRGPVVVSV
jgi:hypothetical protein